MKKPVVGLALGGGGALGYAHIGVIEALEESDIHVDCVAGTSMGAIVGGAYASGLTIAQMKAFASKVRTFDLIDLNLRMGGVLSGRKAKGVLKRIMPDIKIEETNIPFRCVAVDILSGKEYVWKKGSLIQAVRSSMSVPGVFVPVKHEKLSLVDGGIVNNVPEDVVRDMGADIVIGIDVIGEYKMNKAPLTSVSNIASAMFLMQYKIMQLTPVRSDLRIEIQQNNAQQFMFNGVNAEKSIVLGKQETLKNIDKIKEMINSFNKK